MTKSIRRNTGMTLLLKLGAALIFLCMIFYVSAVYRYGNFNIFGSPHRVFFGEYRYDNNETFVTLSDREKPQIYVSSFIDRIVGKSIYSYDDNYIGNGRTVYLHVKDDKYRVLVSSGGP